MDYTKLSREVSYALRHAPWEYKLELDKDGWIPMEQLLHSLKTSGHWPEVTEQDLHAMMAAAEKQRFEIGNGKIRASYGHSLPTVVTREMQEPPESLYHGTARRFLPSIRAQGLSAQSRQYVHLAMDGATAVQVGKRRDHEPVILLIHAQQAWQEGVKFYRGNDKVWLADFIPSRYIDELAADT